MTNTERRLNHMLENWISERFHASKDKDDVAILAAIQAEMAGKIAATFKRKFPTIMGPC